MRLALGLRVIRRKTGNRRSLVLETSVTIFLVGVGLALFFAACILPFVRGQEHDRQIAHIEDMLSTVESTVRIACFVGDKALAEEIARGLMTNHAVAAVRITAARQTLADMGTESLSDVGNPVVKRPIGSPFDSSEAVGAIELTGNRDFIEGKVASYASLVMAMLLVEVLAVTFVVGIVVLRSIIRPIQGFSKDLNRGRYLIATGHNRHNEIGALARNVNDMMDRLSQLLQDEKSIRAEVAQSEHRLRTLLDHMPDIVIRYDLECRRVFVNPAYARETGIRMETASDSEVDDATIWRPTMPLDDFRHRLRAVMKSGQPDHIVLEWTDVLGALVSHEMFLVAERDTEGRTVGALAIGRNVTERKAAEQQLLHQATHDALTGLPNRILLKDRLEQYLVHAHRESEHMAVVFVDLDNFKGINDTLGHETGDELLKIVAARMRGALREEDTVARFGGDEFVILVRGHLSIQGLDTVVRKIFDSISAPCVVGDQRLYPGASMGVSVFPEDGATSDVLMRNADMAMFVAKGQGRNCYRFFSSEMNQDMSEWMELGTALRQALERNEFELYYQPKTCARRGRLAGFEALIRWRHAERGLVSPAQFIPLAEESGLIVPMGEWVVREACRQYREWLDAGLEPVKIAVNLSPLQCKNADFVNHVGNMLARYRLKGEWLEVEVTESVAMSEASIRNLSGLRELGVQIAMDDFGTGYSSLSYVKRLPINCLKIDRSFVSEIENSVSDVQIVNAIVAMAHSLDLDVCAEGVETKAQLDLLQKVGCDQIQGYFLSKPVPSADAARLMRERQVWH